jgi:VWFA-related protein
LLRTATAAASLAVAIAISILPLGAAAPRQTQTFRSSVDLIAVDVRVIDRSGRPVLGLTPANFRVSIDRQPRKVVSAAFARYETTPLPTRQKSPATVGMVVSSTPPALLAPPPAPAGRTFVMVMDAGSFVTLDSRAAATAAQLFVDQLLPTDAVGLFTLPYGTVIDPTTNHATVRAAVAKVVGRRQNYLKQGSCELSVEQVVDITSALERMPRSRVTVDAACPDLARDEVIELATLAGFHLEQDLWQQLDGLDHLFRVLQTWPGSKTVLLLSGGMPTTDRLSGRPNVGNALTKLGQEAAYANATVHALYFNSSFIDAFSAANQGRPSAECAYPRHLHQCHRPDCRTIGWHTSRRRCRNR